MNLNEQFFKATIIVSSAFNGKYDKSGSPYILHCIEVMQGVRKYGMKLMIPALMHDLIEDCHEWSFDRLISEGFSEETIEILRLLTKEKNSDYFEYIKRIAENKSATLIKLSDLAHNMDIKRLPDFTNNTSKRLKKYHIAFSYLTTKINSTI